MRRWKKNSRVLPTEVLQTVANAWPTSLSPMKHVTNTVWEGLETHWARKRELVILTRFPASKGSDMSMSRQTTYNLLTFFLGNLGAPNSVVFTEEGSTIIHQVVSYNCAFLWCERKRRSAATRGVKRDLTSHCESQEYGKSLEGRGSVTVSDY